jgi:preprotein translocase subunit SecA
MFGFIKNLFDPNKRAIKQVEPIVEKILALEKDVKELSFEQMRDQADKYRGELKELIEKLPPEAFDNIRTQKELHPLEKQISDKLQEFLPSVFAYLREINRRKFNKPHFPVQLMASVILAQGNKLTELKTGEGKTQVFHLPAALYGLTGRGSHVVTVNDYLARRDGEYAGHALADLGISVGIITPLASYKFVKDEDLLKVKGPEAEAERKKINVASLSDMHGINLVECPKREAYEQDVVYGTNNEFGFDYLRDNMVYRLNDRVQRELYYCIVDEADSILIDEARTPLIISAPAEESNELYSRFAQIAAKLNAEKHYVLDEKAHSATLTEDGIAYVEQLLGVKNLWEDYQLAHHLDNALKALTLYKNNEEYIVKNGEVLIVDEFTGRILPGRRYSEGLHQAIEAKEGVQIKKESKTLATITFQNYFRIYKVLSGGSGTIMTEAEEFSKIYRLDSYVIPTNKPNIRIDHADKIYKSKLAKFNAVADEIINIHASGQPVLVGTTTIEDSEFLSSLLDKKGIAHEVLNAKFHEREAAIVAKAGQLGSVTVATNMAGRGTDIPLGDKVKELGGLYIIGTQRHEARRVDNQLRGRAGRQGDPGATQFFVALDDEIMRIQGGDMVKKFMEMTKIPDDIPIQSPLVGRAIESAQKKMEGYHFDIRKRVVDYDDVVNQQREIFYLRRLNVVKLQNNDEDNEIIKSNIRDYLSQEISQIIVNHYESKSLTEDERNTLINAFGNLFLEEDGHSLKKIIEIVKNNEIEEIEKQIIELGDKLLDEKFSELKSNITDLYKYTTLQIMDELWTEHLDLMTDLREGIGLRGYAQRDPLVEYKNEAFDLFEKFIARINSQTLTRFMRIRAIKAPSTQVTTTTNADQISDLLTGSRELAVNQPKGSSKPITNTKSKYDKVGRNDPCPCGSGLKYKKCGLINSPKHKG